MALGSCLLLLVVLVIAFLRYQLDWLCCQLDRLPVALPVGLVRLMVRYLSAAGRRLLFTALCCFFFAIHQYIFSACCLLFDVHCLLFAVSFDDLYELLFCRGSLCFPLITHDSGMLFLSSPCFSSDHHVIFDSQNRKT